MSTNTTTRAPATWVRVVAIIGGIGFLLFGLWALAGPRSFFDTLADFEPYNAHFLHDIGAFQIGLGLVLLLASFPDRLDGLAAALLGAGGGAVAHVISHLMDTDLGGNPATDIPTFTVLALVLLAAGVAQARSGPSRR